MNPLDLANSHILCIKPNGAIETTVHGPIHEELVDHYDNIGLDYVVVQGSMRPREDIHTGWYVDPGTHLVRRRKAMPILVTKLEIQADGHDFATITGIPPQAVITIDGQRHDMTNPGDPLEIAADMPATYRIKVTCWPFHDWEAEIRAV